MTLTQAKKYLKKACKKGYVPYHNGIVSMECPKRWGGNTTGYYYGINIDGDGHDGRYSGCPSIIWNAETVSLMFD